MLKKDLKTGMVVEARNGRRFLVMLNADDVDRSLIDFDRGWMPLSEYNEDLTYYNEPWSIDKVYSVGSNISYILGDKNRMMRNATLLWDRNVEVVMTISEIEEKLGIKNLKIKGEN